MTNFKNLATVAALAAGAVTSAHASQTEYSTFSLFNANENTPGVYTGSYAIDTTIGDSTVDADYNSIPFGVAGDTFVDYLVFAIEDPQTLSFFSNVTYGNLPGFGTVPTALISSIGLFDFTGGAYTSTFRIDTPIAFYESGLTLNTGGYYLEVTGQYLLDGGGFTGSLSTTPAVPEPANLALMLAGVGAICAMARRRKVQA